MARQRRHPCLIGVASRTWHPSDVGPDGAPEPLAMWEEMARAAARDAGTDRALSGLGRIDVVYCQGWQYDDPPARLADRLGCSPSVAHYSGIGGTVPLSILDDVARAMLGGDLDVALVVGAEPLATLRRLRRGDGRASWLSSSDAPGPTWSFPPAERRPFPLDVLPHDGELVNGILPAYCTFALFDSARRAHLRIPFAAHGSTAARLLSPMTGVAAANPEAWFRQAYRSPEISEATPDNRMVAFPYTKRMTAVMDVDMAAAVLLATDEAADQLGVPADRRVYLRGWAYAEDPAAVAEREELWRSPAMAVAARNALGAAGLGLDDLAHLDLYSCFPSSVAFALDALGVSQSAASGEHDTTPRRPVTLTGGLPYHGGPGSNYVTHSLAALARALREDPDPRATGMVSGVGMHMTKHAFSVLSTERPDTAPVPPDPAALTRDVEADLARRPVVTAHEGKATVAAISVLHARDGAPSWGALVCDLPGGGRGYARLEDPDALIQAETEEVIGRPVRLRPGDEGATEAVL